MPLNERTAYVLLAYGLALSGLWFIASRFESRSTDSDVRQEEISHKKSNKKRNNKIQSVEKEKRVEPIQTELKSMTNDQLNASKVDKLAINTFSSGKEPIVRIDDRMAARMDDRQIEGIRFLYTKIIESVTDYDINGGSGCVVLSSDAIRRTVQVIAFVKIFLGLTPAKLVLIVLPIDSIAKWELQLEKWVEDHISWFDVHKQFGTVFEKTISKWKRSGGVLLIGFEKYRSVTSKANNEVLRALRDPGPDLVILDGGHHMKNIKTKTYQSLQSMRTKRRVILTDYRHLNENIEMFSGFVRPQCSDSSSEFRKQFVYSTDEEIRDASIDGKKEANEEEEASKQL